VEQRTLGPSGLLVSVVGLGCNQFGSKLDLEGTRKVVHAAIDHGITLFDTSDSYGNMGGSETQLGQVLGDRRKDIVLATKFCSPMDNTGRLQGASRRYIMQAVEASLKRLRTDWIDLYQLHKPDPRTPIAETLGALDDLVRQGKVRYVGCSNLPGWQVVEADWTARHHGLAAFISCQDEYNLLDRGIERELVPAAQRYGLGLLPFFPLAAGLLTGKYRRNAALPADSRITDTPRYTDRYLTDAYWPRVEALNGFAEKHGRSMLELAFSWLACRPQVASVIAGATKPEQIAANVKAAGWKLSAAEMAEIDGIVPAR